MIRRAFPAQKYPLLRVEHRLFRVVRAADGAAVEQRLIAGKRKELEFKRRLDDALRLFKLAERIERIEQQRQNFRRGLVLRRDALGHLGKIRREREQFDVLPHTVEKRDCRRLVKIVPVAALIKRQLGKGQQLAACRDAASLAPRAARDDRDPPEGIGQNIQYVVGLLRRRRAKDDALSNDFFHGGAARPFSARGGAKRCSPHAGNSVHSLQNRLSTAMR